jgi:MYXO-CTERM domain-containing protein
MIRVASVAALFTALGWTGAAYAGVRLTKGPYVTGVFTTGADVRFELDQASPATVTVARDADPGSALRTFESRDLQGIHAVNVTGLEVATRYAYSVRSGGVGLGEGHFSTAPHDGSNAAVTFLVYGDDRTDTTAHGAIVRAMLQVPSAFLVNTGDMVADGGDADAWQTFFDVEAPLLRDRPLFVAIGNHELVNDSAGVNFARYFGFPDVGGQTKLYGTLRFGFVRLFFLNAMHGLDSGEEREWLARELASSDTEAGVVWRIAVTHHGPWSSGPHGPNGKLLDAHIPELLAAHQIDLILSGHDHIYERGSSGNLKYLVSGGGGAPLYPIGQVEATSLKAESTYHFVEITLTPSKVNVVARRVDGTVLDRCGFGKDRPWDCDPPRPIFSAPAGATPPPRASQSARCSCESGSRGVNRPALFVMALFVGFAALRRRKTLWGHRTARGPSGRSPWVRTRRVFAPGRAALRWRGAGQERVPECLAPRDRGVCQGQSGREPYKRRHSSRAARRNARRDHDRG